MICVLPVYSATLIPHDLQLSGLPGRHMAGSSMSGRFVAARTKMPWRGSSTSSLPKMMMHGEEAHTRANT
jgi:hypothetical protein